MAYSLVSGQVASSFSASLGTGISAIFPVAATPGNLIVVYVSGQINIASMTDGSGQPYTKDRTLNGTIGTTEIWHAIANSSTGSQISASYVVNTTFRSMAIHEFTGNLVDVGLLDLTAGNDTQGINTSATSDAVTPTSSGQLVFTAARFDAASSPSVFPNSPFTPLSGPGNHDETAYVVQVAPVSVHGDFSCSPGTNWNVILATFKPTVPQPPSVASQYWNSLIRM